MRQERSIAGNVRKGYLFFLALALGYSLGGILMIALLVSQNRTLATDMAPLVDAIMELKVEVGLAETKTERALRGDTSVDTADAAVHLDMAAAFGNAILFGATLDEGTFVATRSEPVRENVTRTMTALESLRDITARRLATLENRQGVGSDADERFDAIYDGLTDQLAELARDPRMTGDTGTQTLIGQARYSLAHGHLLVAEILGGDLGEDFGEATGSFAAAASAVEAIRIPGGDVGLGAQTRALADAIADLSALASERYDLTLRQSAEDRALADAYEVARAKAFGRIDDAETIIQTYIARELENARATGLVFAALFVMASVAMVLVSHRLYRLMQQRVVGRVRDLTDSITAISAGDHTVAVPDWEARDEMGTLRDAVLSFRDALVAQAALEEDARAATEEARRAMEQAQTFEQEARAMAEVQAQNAAVVVAAGSAISQRAEGFVTISDALSDQQQQQRSLLQNVQQNMRNIESAVDENDRVATAARTITGRVQTQVESGARVMQDVVETVEAMAARGAEISGYVGVIEDISFQTNLLALNASVEASRAGEAGAGFAIVATEVRNLSKRTADAAESIRSLIDKTGKLTHQGVTAVNRAGEQLTQIEGAIGELESGIADVETASRKQAEAIAETAQAFDAFERTFHAAEDLSRQFVAAGQDILTHARELGAQGQSDGTAVRSRRTAA